MIKMNRNNAFSGLKFDTEGAKIVYLGKCVALRMC